MLEHPAGRTMLTAAYLLKFWAQCGMIPYYSGLIEQLVADRAALERRT
jgi:hypothetical protein